MNKIRNLPKTLPVAGPSRFDVVPYDASRRALRDELQGRFRTLEAAIDGRLPPSQHRDLAFECLQAAMMWLGKAMRDEQIRHNKQEPASDAAVVGIRPTVQE